jgi:hypothetical protein
MSGVALTVPPTELEALMVWLSRHAKTIIIMDDIANTYGDIPLMRGGNTPWVLQPFAKVLARHRFSLDLAQITPVQDRAYSGLIVARNINPL